MLEDSNSSDIFVYDEFLYKKSNGWSIFLVLFLNIFAGPKYLLSKIISYAKVI